MRPRPWIVRGYPSARLAPRRSPLPGDETHRCPEMNSPARIIMALTAVAACILLGESGGAAAKITRPTQAGIGLVQFGNDNVTDRVSRRYAYVFVGPSAHGGAGPATRLAYKSAIDLDTGCKTSGPCISGVTYRESKQRDWVLRSPAGEEMASAHYRGMRLADVGNRQYQRRWLQNVSHFLNAHRSIRGVFIDNVVASLSIWSGGQRPAKYPSDAIWEEAMARFSDYVGPALKAKGFYVATNALKYLPGDSRSDTGQLNAEWWERIAPSVSGFFCEYWQQNPNNTTEAYYDDPKRSWMGSWAGWERLVATAQSHQRDFFGMQYADSKNLQLLRYGRASFLLAWNGRGGAYVVKARDTLDPWKHDWALEIGRPRGRRWRVGLGWRRDYTRGTVIVNPNPSTPQNFSLGSRYRTPEGSIVSSVTLAPISALILERAHS
jgi:hypothetical protein